MMRIALLTLTILALLLQKVSALANCPNPCKCNDDTLEVQCDEGTLGVLPIALNPFVQKLVISNNKIKTIDSSLQFYAELTYLDLSYNDLTNIPLRTFGNQRRLKTLDFNHNKISDINNKTFNGLSAVTLLNLRGNMLAQLKNEVFANMPKLEELNLGENRISSIDERAFAGLNKLSILYLDDNTLSNIPAPQTFAAMPNLSQLYLGINSFLDIPSAAFENLKSLTRLNLRGAGLRNISQQAFKGLTNLRFLELSDNRFEKVPTIALSHLERLETLNIGENDFELLEANAFNNLQRLTRLHIAAAPLLRRIEAHAFASNLNLKYLNISYNKQLSFMHENALFGLTHLQQLVLKGNQLESLSEGRFPWQDLQTFDLTDNPWICDCRLVWLRNLLIAKNSSAEIVQAISCVEPSSLEGQLLHNLTPQLLGCSNNEVKKQTIIGIMLVVIVASISALAFLLYGCRRRLRQLLKGSCWGSSALGHKGREYQKTFSADEEYMARLQQQQHQQQHQQQQQNVCTTNLPYGYPNDLSAQLYTVGGLNGRSIPVTEL